MSISPPLKSLMKDAQISVLDNENEDITALLSPGKVFAEAKINPVWEVHHEYSESNSYDRANEQDLSDIFNSLFWQKVRQRFYTSAIELRYRYAIKVFDTVSSSEQKQVYEKYKDSITTDLFDWVEQKQKSKRFEDGIRYSTHIDECLPFLVSIAKIADFGDNRLGVTRVDDQVRRGRQIHIGVDAPLNIVSVPKSALNDLKNHFTNQTGIHNVEIRPYKLNFYQKGDFFVEHVDSPEPGLLATMIIVLKGDPSSFVIDGNVWHAKNTRYGDLNCMIFWCDVPHKVDPVKCESKVTLTFKVFASSPMSASTILSSRHNTEQETNDMFKILSSPYFDQDKSVGESNLYLLFDMLGQRMNQPLTSGLPAGLVLQNGYACLDQFTLSDDWSNYATLDFLKGVDRFVYFAALNICKHYNDDGDKYRLKLVPIVVVQTNCGEEKYGDCEIPTHVDVLEDCDEDCNSEREFSTPRRIAPHYWRPSKSVAIANGEEGSNSTNSMTEHCVAFCEVSDQVKSHLSKKYSSPSNNDSSLLLLSLPKKKLKDLYFMTTRGYLYACSREKNCFVGNVTNGVKINNFYFNMMIYFEPVGVLASSS